HPMAGVRLDAIERITDLEVHGFSEAVELVGTIEGQPGDAVGGLEKNIGVVHGDPDTESDVPPALYDAEAVGDKGRIGIRGVGRRVAASAVKIGERRRLVDEDTPGQVDRQGYLCAPGRLRHFLDDGLAGAVDGCGQGAVATDDVL